MATSLITAKDCLAALIEQPLKKIDDLPVAAGIYALSDHLGEIHYIGITAADSFRDRIYSRHVNGSEERSHKLACNYNIGRMWRNRKAPFHVAADAKLAKLVRKEFIRRHCRAACVPSAAPKAALEVLEKELIAIAPTEMVIWNKTRKRVNRLPEPRELVDEIISDLGFGQSENAALERQARLFELHGHEDLAE